MSYETTLARIRGHRICAIDTKGITEGQSAARKVTGALREACASFGALQQSICKYSLVHREILREETCSSNREESALIAKTGSSPQPSVFDNGDCMVQTSQERDANRAIKPTIPFFACMCQPPSTRAESPVMCESSGFSLKSASIIHGLLDQEGWREIQKKLSLRVVIGTEVPVLIMRL